MTSGEKMAKIKGYLALCGDDFDTGYVSDATGVLPSRIRRNDEVLGNGRLFGHTEWCIETDVHEAEDIEPVLAELFGRITKNCDAKALLAIAANCSADWHISLWLRFSGSKTPGICLSPSTIQFMASINAGLDIDAYVCGEV